MENLENGRIVSNELIRKYLKNELSISEIQWFEKQLDTNPELQAKTELIEGLIRIREQPELIKAGSVLLKLRSAQLKKTGQDNLSGQSTLRFLRFLKSPLVIIPFFLLLAALLSILVINNRDLERRELLFEQHLIAHPGMLNLPTDQTDKLYYPVLYYQEGSWNEATQAFLKIKDDELIYKFQYIVSSINIPDKKWEDYRNDIAMLSQLKEELLEENKILHQLLVEWIDFYIALIQIKQGNYEEGKNKILEMAVQEVLLEPSLQEAVNDLVEKL